MRVWAADEVHWEKFADMVINRLEGRPADVQEL